MVRNVSLTPRAPSVPSHPSERGLGAGDCRTSGLTGPAAHRLFHRHRRPDPGPAATAADVLPGRTGNAYAGWLRERDDEWRRSITRKLSAARAIHPRYGGMRGGQPCGPLGRERVVPAGLAMTVDEGTPRCQRGGGRTALYQATGGGG